MRPCGSRPTFMVLTSPVDVSIAYTTLSKRPDSQSNFPSALTFPMSGLPPAGMNQVTLTRWVEKSMTLTLPGP